MRKRGPKVPEGKGEMGGEMGGTASQMATRSSMGSPAAQARDYLARTIDQVEQVTIAVGASASLHPSKASMRATDPALALPPWPVCWQARDVEDVGLCHKRKEGDGHLADRPSRFPVLNRLIPGSLVPDNVLSTKSVNG